MIYILEISLSASAPKKHIGRSLFSWLLFNYLLCLVGVHTDAFCCTSRYSTFWIISILL